jgi:hypothetical protein
MKKKIKKSRRGALNKEQRLAVALKKHFMQSPDLIYKIRRYASWFYVKPETAISELRQLGVVITSKDIKAFKKSAAAIKQAKRERRAKRKADAEQALELLENTDSDETFAYIAGYTSAGFPYGVTWEEMEAAELQEQTAISEKSNR